MSKNSTEHAEIHSEHVHDLLADKHGPEREGGMLRRDFLKIAGFTVAVAAAGCERPADSRVMPHVRLDPEATPGTSEWYAGVCAGCTAGCGILVRSRDNRPVKIEGIPAHPVSGGGLCAAGQAVLLALYDEKRLVQPQMGGSAVSWEQVDSELMSELDQVRRRGGRVRVLSGTITSPTMKRTIDGFLATFADAKHVMYDALSASALLDVHEQVFGKRAAPRPRFDLARVIVSFDADFLGTWISPVEYSAAWKAGRNPDGSPADMSWHMQIESRLSLTGTKADERIALRSAERFALLRHLEHRIALKAGTSPLIAPTVKPPVAATRIEELATRLWQHRGRSLVLCGSNHPGMQASTLRINHMLGNYGTTLDIGLPSLQKQGSDAALHSLAEELRRGDVDVLITLGANPAYDAPDSWKLGELLAKPPLSIRFTTHTDESSRGVRYILPMPHSLEDWSDAEPFAGTFCLSQPAIPPIKTLRAVTETFAKWSGAESTAYDRLRSFWRDVVFPGSGAMDFEAFWREALVAGSVQLPAAKGTPTAGVSALQNSGEADPVLSPSELELVVHPRVGLPDSSASRNAWLIELPDPITKSSWENVATVSKKTAAALKIGDGDVVRLVAAAANTSAVDLPVIIQEGQADGTIAVTLGYGGLATARYAAKRASWWLGTPSVGKTGRVGARVSGLLAYADNILRYEGMGVSVAATGGRVDLAMAQEYHYLAVPGPDGDGSGAQRPCAQEITTAQLISGHIHKGPVHEQHSMWPEHEYNGHHWGMTIDLNACTGCSACVIGCQVENNIPVVGKDEVRRNRDLHWLRIDRYYFKDDTDALRVTHQPMLCHHCDNAPCETVCPVLATVHSSEGLNQQVYNRCVGTRYCSNNCPYKVRRFNWFDYTRNDEENLTLNPDVTVRTRGVMEKCSFCVQRIQEAKIVAKGEQRQPADGEIQPACMQSCPTRAITFGDMNDRNSVVSKEIRNPRHYRVLDEIGVRPSVGYLMQVRNSGTMDKEEGNG